MIRIGVFIVQLVFFAALVQAQNDSVWIDEVPVISLKNRFEPVGSVVETLDSSLILHPTYSTAQLLNEQAGLFVKSYGLNSLSSLSLRGASAQQTLILWNGLPIQSPTLGQMDASLLPVSLAQSVRVQYGGNSSSWGSGAIGGTVSLENNAAFDSSFHLQYLSNIGSFHGFQQQLGFKLAGKKFISSTQVLYQKAQNNFPYKKADNLANEMMQNNVFEQRTLMQSFYYKPKSNHLLSSHLWLQDAYKEIPPLITQNQSLANQKDKILRWMIAWDFNKRNLKSNAKLAYFKENQQYSDQLLALHNTNLFHNILAEENLSFLLNQHHSLQTSITNIFSIAHIDAYQQVRHQNRFSGLLTYQFAKKKWMLQSSIRLQLVDKKVLLPIPLFGWSYKINNALVIQGKLSRDFRLPTLNDLYWQPGGNESLQPESGFSQEISTVFKINKNPHHFTTIQTLYNRNINHWILWSPSNNGFWQANNINKVWSKGWESKLDYTYYWKKQTIQLSQVILYSSSTFRNTLNLPKIEKGEQLFYTPVWQLKNNLCYSYQDFKINLMHQWVGNSNGANEQVASYHIVNMHLSYHFTSIPFNGLIYVTCNNLLNKPYFVIERRPMPGINFQAGIQINFSKPLKH